MREYVYKNIKYLVSEDGRIIKNGVEIRQYDNGSGYMQVTLAGKMHYVQRVVASCYLPNPENKAQVNHKNGKRADNRVENLEWVTCSENHLHAFRVLHRNHSRSNLGRKGFLHHRSRAVVQIDKLTNNQVQIHGSIEQAAKAMGVSSRAIWSAINKKNRMQSCKGFKWEYA